MLGGNLAPCVKNTRELLATAPPVASSARYRTTYYFGPVHVVVSFEDYTSVRVPSLNDPTELIWVNVQKVSARFAYCIIAAAEWPDWRNLFREREDVATLQAAPSLDWSRREEIGHKPSVETATGHVSIDSGRVSYKCWRIFTERVRNRDMNDCCTRPQANWKH